MSQGERMELDRLNHVEVATPVPFPSLRAQRSNPVQRPAKAGLLRSAPRNDEVG